MKQRWALLGFCTFRLSCTTFNVSNEIEDTVLKSFFLKPNANHLCQLLDVHVWNVIALNYLQSSHSSEKARHPRSLLSLITAKRFLTTWCLHLEKLESRMTEGEGWLTLYLLICKSVGNLNTERQVQETRSVFLLENRFLQKNFNCSLTQVFRFHNPPQTKLKIGDQGKQWRRRWRPFFSCHEQFKWSQTRWEIWNESIAAGFLRYSSKNISWKNS